MEIVLTNTTLKFKIVTPKSPAPTFALDGNNIVINASEGAEIYYTLDGTEPTVNSTRYTGVIPFSMAVDNNFVYTKVKAIAVLPEHSPSNVEKYKIGDVLLKVGTNISNSLISVNTDKGEVAPADNDNYIIRPSEITLRCVDKAGTTSGLIIGKIDGSPGLQRDLAFDESGQFTFNFTSSMTYNSWVVANNYNTHTQIVFGSVW